jgi:hypothetical protein
MTASASGLSARPGHGRRECDTPLPPKVAFPLTRYQQPWPNPMAKCLPLSRELGWIPKTIG